MGGSGGLGWVGLGWVGLGWVGLGWDRASYRSRPPGLGILPCPTTRLNCLTVRFQGRSDYRQPPDLTGALVSGRRRRRVCWRAWIWGGGGGALGTPPPRWGAELVKGTLRRPRPGDRPLHEDFPQPLHCGPPLRHVAHSAFRQRTRPPLVFARSASPPPTRHLFRPGPPFACPIPSPPPPPQQRGPSSQAHALS